MAIRPGKKKNYSRILKTRLQPNSKKQKGYSHVFKTWLQAELSYSHVFRSYSHVLKRGSWYSVVSKSFLVAFILNILAMNTKRSRTYYSTDLFVTIGYILITLLLVYVTTPPYLCKYCPFWSPYSSQFCFSSQSTQQWVKNDSSP